MRRIENRFLSMPAASAAVRGTLPDVLPAIAMVIGFAGCATDFLAVMAGTQFQTSLGVMRASAHRIAAHHASANRSLDEGHFNRLTGIQRQQHQTMDFGEVLGNRDDLLMRHD